MVTVPPEPKIYHITHMRNLPGIIEAGRLWSDSKVIELGIDCNLVGMSDIKKARLTERPVKCFPDSMVGEYVPFYFCPRSIMLYILYMGNHPGITYMEGQSPIVHLRADMHTVRDWADQNEIRWAFSSSNAGAAYTDFYRDLGNLDQINWSAVSNNDFRSPEVFEGKWAEFLVEEQFPWELVEKIGVINSRVQEQVLSVLNMGRQAPQVVVERGWYF